jgi:hypothetical protein
MAKSLNRQMSAAAIALYAGVPLARFTNIYIDLYALWLLA